MARHAIERRGAGLAKWLVDAILRHADLQGLRRWLLATRDAHGLHAQFGFVPLANPSRILERLDSAVYGRLRATPESTTPLPATSMPPPANGDPS